MRNPYLWIYRNGKFIVVGDQKSARTFRDYLEKAKRSRNTKDRVLSLRLRDEDMDRLQSLTEKMGTRNYGETIRNLISRSSDSMG